MNLAWKELHREAAASDDLETLKSLRAIEAKERELEYKMELEKMMMRVQQQPTLFQRQTRVRVSLGRLGLSYQIDRVNSKIR